MIDHNKDTKRGFTAFLSLVFYYLMQTIVLSRLTPGCVTSQKKKGLYESERSKALICTLFRMGTALALLSICGFMMALYQLI